VFICWAPLLKVGRFSGGQPIVPTAVLQSITSMALLQAFLDLTKFLLGKPYPKAREATLHEIEHPLAWLMEGLPISAEVWAITQEDIQLHQSDTKA
jgi:hypothetical protein